MTRKCKQFTRLITPGIQRPGRYLGLEWNLPPLPPSPKLRLCFIFPDVYEVGMSHLGLLILYQMAIQHPCIAAERAFAPWPDLETRLREKNTPLTSIETHRPLSEFDAIFITLPHELCFTNILSVLDLGGIPIIRAERKNCHPIILGGGICSLNPLPLADFFDAIYIGEAEVMFNKIIETLEESSGKKSPRNDIYLALSQIEGMFVPEVHEPEVMIRKHSHIHRQFLADLETAPYPLPPLVPVTRPIHERIVIEAARGCPRQCNFCQARIYYGPYRRRSPEKITEIAKTSLAASGYEELSLLSLSIADYPGIEHLIESLIDVLKPTRTAVSLPSLRPEKLSRELIDYISKIRKTGFTLAPEAGSDRLRRLIGKPYNSDKLLDTVEMVFQSGWSLLKLYFMIGQPFELDSDIEGIAELIKQIRKIGQKIQGNRCEINVSVSTFVPKPHTPFQWHGQTCRETLEERIRYLKEAVKHKSIKLSYHDIDVSRLESILSRGDIHSGQLLTSGYLKGCRFDSWREWFKADKWKQSYEEIGIDPEEESCRHLPDDREVPWAFIDSGISQLELKEQYQKTVIESREIPEEYTCSGASRTISSAKKSMIKPSILRTGTSESYEYLGLFSVMGDYRLFGHLEITAALMRAARRTKLAFEYTSGFNPRLKFSFQPPPPLGFERLAEPFVCRLTEDVDPLYLNKQFNLQLPDMMKIHGMVSLQHTYSKILNSLNSITYGFSIDPELSQILPHRFVDSIIFLDTREYLEQFKQSGSILPESKYNFFFVFPAHPPKDLNLKNLIMDLFRINSKPIEEIPAIRWCWNVDAEGKQPVVFISKRTRLWTN
ncbi:TIGR03960 family B12-binding radical SAM protein [bacterium]|nr:TIGR03960 family B12-binding radical SAM protein [candidate division CSSED10-310 bacterium]